MDNQYNSYPNQANTRCKRFHHLILLFLAISLVFFSSLKSFAADGKSTSNNFSNEEDSTSKSFGTKKEINQNPVTVSAFEISPQEFKSGESAEIKLKIKIAPGYHAYVDQYRLELKEPKDAYLSEFQISPTVKFNDPISKKIKMGTADYAEMIALFETPAATSGGSYDLVVKLTYQACADDFCLLPKTIEAKTQFTVPMRGEDALSRALGKSLLSALLLVFLAGFLTSLTPCIFPMIPITLAVIGTKDVGHSRWRGFSVTAIYVLGIAITYATLGVAAARTGAMFGSLLGHPLVVGLIALLFVAMGLSMYGLYEIQVPQFIMRRVSGTKLEKGYIGAFISGLLAGVVASPCVGPVLVSILAYVAKTQDSALGFLLLFVFAIGLGQLFLLMGTFQGLLHKLPRSGPWMENIKFVFGTLMIGMALYFLHPITSGILFSGIIATVLILLGVFFGAFARGSNQHRSNEPHPPLHFGAKYLFSPFKIVPKWQKALSRITLVAGLLFAVRGFVPEHMESVFPFLSGQSATQTYAKPEWNNYSEELLALAKKEGRPVILDFQAEWCLACKELEIYTFSDPRVLEIGKKFIWMKFDATKSSPELDVLQERYGIGGLPFVTFFDSKGEWQKELTLLGFEKADPFLKRLQSLVK